MPLLHCHSCHHEWEGSKTSKCDWCGADGYVIQDETNMEAWAAISANFRAQIELERTALRMVGLLKKEEE